MQAIKELKIKAKIHQKAALKNGQQLTLTECQQQLAKKIGFNHWHHALEALSGKNQIKDYGKLWHHPKCDALLNIWFANYEEAKDALTENPDKFLLPYKTQFVLVTGEYLSLIGINEALQIKLRNEGGDLVSANNYRLWDEFALASIKQKR